MTRPLLVALVAFGLSPSARAAGDDIWDLEIGIDDAIYPSLVIATSTLHLEDEEEDETALGDPLGLIGVAITAPADNAEVMVEVSSGTLIKPSRFTGKLAKKGETYHVFPMLKFDYNTLLAVRQPYPELITATVKVNGKALGEKSMRVPVRSINDCVLGYTDEEGQDWNDTTWMMAAYVNENHPVVDEILGEALDAGSVDSFAGYQKKPDEVLEEVQAIWDALKERGFKYSNITQASGVSRKVASQHVRLLGDSTKTAQANCVEGSVLFASVLRKLGMDTFLVLIPGHMFVGVFLDAEQENHICIETTMLGSSEFADAVETAKREFDEHAEALTSDEDDQKENTGCSIIRIEEARKMGVMPIRDAGPIVPAAK